MEIVEVNLQGLAEWNVDPIITVRVRWIVVWISGTNKSVVLHISTRTFNKIKIILKRTSVTYDDDGDLMMMMMMMMIIMIMMMMMIIIMMMTISLDEPHKFHLYSNKNENTRLIVQQSEILVRLSMTFMTDGKRQK